MNASYEPDSISVDKLSLALTCRTCLNTDSQQDLIPIFSRDHDSGKKAPFELFRQLQFLKLEITEDDGLPKNICCSCMERLSAVNDFRMQCERAHEFLVRYFVDLPVASVRCKVEADVDYTDLEYLSDPINEECSIDVSKQKQEIATEVAEHDDIDQLSSTPKVLKKERMTFGLKFHREETIDNLQESSTKESLICPECGKVFQSVSNRNSHLLLHNEGNNYKCDICEHAFKSKFYLNRHKKAVHTVGDHTCAHCEAHFTSSAKYEYHLKSHNPDKRHQCSFCPKSFLQHHHLLNHERTHTGSRPFLCNICGKEFRHEPSFKTHLKIHDGLRPHVCEICSKCFVHRTTYLQHMENHKKTFQCEHCGKNFSKSSSKLVHMKTHSAAEQLFRCELCNESFGTDHQLKDHTAIIHNAAAVIEDSNPMLEKKRIFRQQSMKNAVKVLPYVCELCNKAFKLPSSLSSHLKIHNEERKHVCKQCGNTFKRAEHLRVHINGVHLKRKPYSCEVCHKKFTQSGDRNLHMRSHMDDKPHLCSECGKGFSLVKALRAHMRLHTGEKPFVCVLCNMSFISYTALDSHTQKHKENNVDAKSSTEPDTGETALLIDVPIDQQS